MNKKSYKRVLALCFALLSSSSCGITQGRGKNLHNAMLGSGGPNVIKQNQNPKDSSGFSSTFFLSSAALGICGFTTAKCCELGPFAKEDEQPDPNIPFYKPFDKPKDDNDDDDIPAGDPGEDPAPIDVNEIKPVLSAKDIAIFEENFNAQRNGNEPPYESAEVNINHGIKGADSNTRLSLRYDSFTNKPAESAPKDYVRRIAALLPLLGKKYCGGDSDSDKKILKYIKDNISDDFGAITIYTAPKGGNNGIDEYTIWMVVDGVTKCSLQETSHSVYSFDPNRHHVVVGACDKFMWGRYADSLFFSDGCSENICYRISKNEVMRFDCYRIRNESLYK